MDVIRFLNDNIIWGIPMLVLMLGTGAYLAMVTKGVLFSKFGTVMRYTGKTLFQKSPKGQQKGSISPFQAVSTALAATVGTGNIVGVAVAIQTGGPGAIFWMWVAALFGMVTKYAEVTLAVAYRQKNKNGELVGGPMYYITKGLHKRRLAVLFCLFGFLSSFGIGNMVQANSLAGGLSASFSIQPWISGIVISILAGCVLIGGIKRISRVTEILVPFMALFYILGALLVVGIHIDRVPAAFSMIFKDAFSGSAAAGGFAGATMLYAMRIGVARGVFTNEAGLGSAPIAHAAANNDHPARQGLWGAFEVFFDTIVMCTITALVILTSGVWQTTAEGSALSQRAFAGAFAGGEYIVSIGLVLFAFASIIAWYYYGEKCLEFLSGSKYVFVYRLAFIAAIFLGCVADLALVWELSDLLNGLMAIPNLIALVALAPAVRMLSRDLFADPHRIRKKNEDFSALLVTRGRRALR